MGSDKLPAKDDRKSGRGQGPCTLRVIRKSRGLSQRTLALAAEVSLSSVFKAESGTDVLRKRTRAKIARAFGFPLEVLFGDRTGDES
jgi:transcriptional regulator with XRE-family HTH domain